MSTYVVMEPEGGKRGERMQLVGDRFSAVAFLLPVIWLAWHRLWIEAFIALAAAFVIGGLAAVAGFQDAAPFLSLIVALFVGLEGPALRIAALERRGFRQRAFIEAESRADAELRYLMERGPDSPAPAPVPERPRAAAPAEGRMLGLIDYPGAR